MRISDWSSDVCSSDLLGPYDAVAVLAGMGALVFADELEGLLGDGAQLPRAVFGLQVDDRPHVQQPDRGMRIPGAARAVLVEHGGQPVGEVGQIRQRHGAVLDRKSTRLNSSH